MIHADTAFSLVKHHWTVLASSRPVRGDPGSVWPAEHAHLPSSLERNTTAMQPLAFPTRWLCIFLSLFGMAVLLGGCGTPPTSTHVATPTPVVHRTPTASSRLPCQTTQLVLAHGEFTSNLGNAGLEFSFANQSRESCTLFGFPTLRFLDAQRQPLPIQVTHRTSGYLYTTRPAQVLVLQPGQKAYFALTWGNMGCSEAAPISASPVALLLVTPPGTQAAVLVSVQLCAFGNQVSLSPLEPSHILGVFLSGGAA